ncbi:GrpB family protein [Methylobacterium gregans]|uniref:GrpB family protein n=1 Tax=Methylobacterium gregans TaxID=374424 RepID=A0AA37HQB5_9HYPH|nr:GrpB family protein [Methylobacterium gregans]MDQ0520579.1 GrpB-like predicted nucleotidyltransferase (UPF0157 family) [Methylobacterium gregans]GJD80074.1 hypothetical protein NBEOAGPD_3309 [Methylobacterium gregans]GLS52162.1 hypothetical protein GCM10007886_03440 [Methylobacterium gregans]
MSPGTTAEPEILRLADPALAARAAWRLFACVRAELGACLPAEAAIEHVGATAEPGCLGKGDLDIAVQVPSDLFAACRAILAQRYADNPGSVRTADFAAFCDAAAEPPLGIQLVAIGSEFDLFVRFRDRLRAEPDLVERYNALKRAHAGRSMAAYRAAKADFIVAVLSHPHRDEAPR